MMTRHSDRREQNLEQWRRYMPLLDAALCGDWGEVSTHLHANGFDNEDFTAFLTQHDIGMTLHYLAVRDGTASVFPSWLTLYFLGTRNWGNSRRQDLGAALAEFAAAADNAKLHIVLLKGFYVGQQFYSTPQARWLRDLDILVHHTEQEATSHLLTTLGYEPERRSRLPLKIKNRLAHALGWYRDNASIDLHHQFRSWPGAGVDVERIIKESSRQTVAGASINVPTDEDCLLMLLMSLAGDIAQGRVSVKNLVDLWAMQSKLDGTIDWDTFFHGRVNDRNAPLITRALSLAVMTLPRSMSFPHLRQALKARRAERSSESPQQALALLSAPQYSLANRIWFLRYYRGSVFKYLCWWLLGGLFRSGSISALIRSMLPTWDRGKR
ncbi:MAG: hypothetical protein ACJA09_002355 [Alcanivorax sp.]|jgi:hypothetical protein